MARVITIKTHAISATPSVCVPTKLILAKGTSSYWPRGNHVLMASGVVLAMTIRRATKHSLLSENNGSVVILILLQEKRGGESPKKEEVNVVAAMPW